MVYNDDFLLVGSTMTSATGTQTSTYEILSTAEICND